MLLHDQLKILQSVRDDPAVTVLWTVPPNGGAAPVDLLLDEVAERLRLEVDAKEVEERLDDLRRLAAETAEERGQRSVALFASRSHRAASRLPEPVRDRVVIDETFATRDLVRALHRSPEYLVLVLAEPFTRLYEGRGRILREVDGGGFPYEVQATTHAGRERRHDPGAARDRHLDELTHDLDRVPALSGTRLGALPVFVVAGPERLAKFTSRSRLGDRIAGRVTHSLGESPSPARLSHLVWPSVEDWMAAGRQLSLAEVDQAMGARRLAAGIDEVWPLAREGRGRLVVVEEGFEYPAHLRHDGQALEHADDPTLPGVVDDAVDEVIEYVLNQKGRAAFVPDGTLADRGRVVLTLRY